MALSNPFQNLEIRIPEEYRDAIDQYSQTQPSGGRKPSPEDSPFPRFVDMWFYALCIGAKKNQPHKPTKWHRFAHGNIFAEDPYRIELIEMIAIAFSSNPYIIENPNEMIRIANELAASGLSDVIELLSSGTDKPLGNLTHSLVSELFED